MNYPRKDDRLSAAFSGRNLELALKKAGVTKHRLAKDLNITYRIVQYWAKGRRPSAAFAQRVAAYFGIQTKTDNYADILADHERRLSRLEAAMGTKKEGA